MTGTETLDESTRAPGLSAPWWRSAVVYQVYLRSFADAEGDGIGDLEGLIDRLGYLDRLGVDALWLTPCYPSPQADHGYDVADYFDIEPTYGDLATFDRLVALARERGIRILMDVVPNHCSSRHPWFQEALAAGPGSPERGRYYFRDGRGPNGDEPPNNWMAWFGGRAWTRVIEADGRPGQWYLHLFTPDQPDFDWTNPEVGDQFEEMLRFWFDRGVEGFRCDAVIALGKAPGLPDTDPVPPGTRDADVAGRNQYTVYRPEGHVVWRRWRALVDEYAASHPGREPYLVAEAYSPRRPDLLLEYLREDEFHQAFSFDLLLSPWYAESLRQAIDESVFVVGATGAPLTWTLNNHDAQRNVTRYGRADATDPHSWTGNNLVNSDAPVDLTVGTRRARAAALLTLSLPGAAYLYQGEELGLPEVLDIPADRREDPLFWRSGQTEIGRDGCRVPLPWARDNEDACGFSSVRGGTGPWLPQPAGWDYWSVSAQEEQPESMLELYRNAVHHRRSRPELRSEAFAWVAFDDPSVLAFDRAGLLVVTNCSGSALTLGVDLVEGRKVLISSVPGHDDPSVLPADCTVWIAAH